MASPGRYLPPARAEECGALSALALRAKAYWGYDPVFIQACREALTVNPADVRAGRVVVLIEEDTPIGFYCLDKGERQDEAEVSLFFVEPAVISRGIGRALWNHMTDTARSRGYKRLRIESDPFAIGFYRAIGATLSGKMRSAVPEANGAERFLPLLHDEL